MQTAAQLKISTEEAIKRLVADQIAIFKEETGLDVSSVSLNFDARYTVGLPPTPSLASVRIYI